MPLSTFKHLHHHDRDHTLAADITSGDSEGFEHTWKFGEGAAVVVREEAGVGTPEGGFVDEGLEGGFAGGGYFFVDGIPSWVGDAFADGRAGQVGGELY